MCTFITIDVGYSAHTSHQQVAKNEYIPPLTHVTCTHTTLLLLPCGCFTLARGCVKASTHIFSVYHIIQAMPRSLGGHMLHRNIILEVEATALLRVFVKWT